MKQSTNLLIVSLATAAACSTLAAGVDLSKLPPPAKQKGVTYVKDIRPILETSCFGCHGEKRQKAGLRLDSLEAALKGSEDGQVITPGKSDKSQLVIAVSRLDEEKAMPPQFKPGGRGPGGPGGPGGQNGANKPVQKDGVPPGPGGPGGPGGGGRGGFGPPPKPLTSEQVSLIRAWIDQGAK